MDRDDAEATLQGVQVEADDHLRAHTDDGHGEVSELAQLLDGGQILENILLDEIDFARAQEFLHLLAASTARLAATRSSWRSAKQRRTGCSTPTRIPVNSTGWNWRSPKRRSL